MTHSHITRPNLTSTIRKDGVLANDMQTLLWEKLKDRWGADRWHDWYPMNGMDTPPNTQAFHITFYHRDVGDQAIRQILAAHEISTIWEMRENGSIYEMEVAGAQFCYYDGNEGYWTSGEMDWLIYASHESSITFAGEWLLPELKKVWPNWQQCIYTGWDQA